MAIVQSETTSDTVSCVPITCLRIFIDLLIIVSAIITYAYTLEKKNTLHNTVIYVW